MENRIKYYRELKGLSQEELANMSGISRQTISSLEKGILKTTTNTTMCKLSKALDVGMFELFSAHGVQ